MSVKQVTSCIILTAKPDDCKEVRTERKLHLIKEPKSDLVSFRF